MESITTFMRSVNEMEWSAYAYVLLIFVLYCFLRYLLKRKT